MIVQARPMRGVDGDDDRLPWSRAPDEASALVAA